MKWFVQLTLGLSTLAVCLTGCSKEPPKAVKKSVREKAPEIEGVDVDGKAMKLSDYRGKVVLLDFWKVY
jgi:hypothetical protein